MGLSLGLLKSQDPIRELGGDEVWQEEEREKGNQSRSDESVLLFSSSTPSSIPAGWSPDWVPYPQKSPKYPKFLRIRLRPVYISHLLSKHLPYTSGLTHTLLKVTLFGY